MFRFFRRKANSTVTPDTVGVIESLTRKISRLPAGISASLNRERYVIGERVEYCFDLFVGIVPDGSASVVVIDDTVVCQLRQVGVSEADSELFSILRWAVFIGGSSPMHLINEVVERGDSVRLVAQVVNDPTPSPVGDKAETFVETVICHTT